MPKARFVLSNLTSDLRSYNLTETKLMTILAFLTPVSMQTTHSELPGPSTGVGADGVTGVPGVPGVSGGLGIWMFEVLGKNGGGGGDGAEGVTSASASCLVTLQAPARGGNGSRDFPYAKYRNSNIYCPIKQLQCVNVTM